MFNILINLVRRLDPASDYDMGFKPDVDAFSWGNRSTGCRDRNGAYVVWACRGEAAIGEYRSQALAAEPLSRARARSRTPRRIVSHTAWRLIPWAKRRTRRWCGRGARLDAVIG